jgi:hypothetical protein
MHFCFAVYSLIMIHNATTKRGIIGLTPPSRAEGTARGSERSGRPRAVPKARGCVLNLYSRVRCGVITLFHSRARERVKRTREREREREKDVHVCMQYMPVLFVRERERESVREREGPTRDKIRERESERV